MLTDIPLNPSSAETTNINEALGLLSQAFNDQSPHLSFTDTQFKSAINGTLSDMMGNINSNGLVNNDYLQGIVTQIAMLFPDVPSVQTFSRQVISGVLQPDITDMINDLNSMGYTCPPYHP